MKFSPASGRKVKIVSVSHFGTGSDSEIGEVGVLKIDSQPRAVCRKVDFDSRNPSGLIDSSRCRIEKRDSWEALIRVVRKQISCDT